MYKHILVPLENSPTDMVVLQARAASWRADCGAR